MLVGDGDNLRAAYWTVYRYVPTPHPDWVEDWTKFHVVLTQLTEYFNGERQQFDILLQPEGTNFQKEVWRELTKIKYGRTKAYHEIAHAIGRPNAARAVGAAIGRNPLSIIVPCHRVVASDGNLTGFAGGIENKRFLLEHEGALPKL